MLLGLEMELVLVLVLALVLALALVPGAYSKADFHALFPAPAVAAGSPLSLVSGTKRVYWLRTRGQQGHTGMPHSAA